MATVVTSKYFRGACSETSFILQSFVILDGDLNKMPTVCKIILFCSCFAGTPTLLALLCSTYTAAATARIPSIVFILSDDLGFGDYEISTPVRPQGGQGRIRTPNIVRLAKNGMRFLQSYSGPICAPSRTVLMTGKHMGHTTIRGNDGSYTPLLPNDTTVAKVLQKTHAWKIAA